MTNAIEQAKREMYKALAIVNECFSSLPTQKFETALESYLELLRQDHEALHETARKRFEDLQVAESDNEDMGARLAKMTEERDSLRNRMQAYEARERLAGTCGQTSGDRASCATPDAKTMAILGSVLDVQRIVSDWALGDSKAKHSMRKIAAVVNGDLEVAKALDAFENPGKYSEMVFHWQFDHGTEVTRSMVKVDRCMHSFFAIGQDQMKCTFCGVGK